MITYEGEWEIEHTDEFLSWWNDLTHEQREALHERVSLLSKEGPRLKRPVVGKIENSRHHNMKEIRVSKGGDLRVLFVFDPRRVAILLLGGDKQRKWKKWYKKAIPQADDRYDRHMAELKEEEYRER